MAEEAKKKLVNAIEVLSDKIKSDVTSNDALKYTQGALNAANAIRTLQDVKDK